MSNKVKYSTSVVLIYAGIAVLLSYPPAGDLENLVQIFYTQDVIAVNFGYKSRGGHFRKLRTQVTICGPNFLPQIFAMKN